MTMFIRDVIRDREPYSLRTSATVLDAARFMSERRSEQCACWTKMEN
jgi:hypothetical protein